MNRDVEELIEIARQRGFREHPLPPHVLAVLRGPNDEVLPPCLKAWFAFSAVRPDFLKRIDPPEWNRTSAREFVEAEMNEVGPTLDDDFDVEEAVSAVLDGVPNGLLDVPWVRLDDSGTQAWFTAVVGEWPVLTYKREEWDIAFPRLIEYLGFCVS